MWAVPSESPNRGPFNAELIVVWASPETESIAVWLDVSGIELLAVFTVSERHDVWGECPTVGIGE